MVRTGWTYLTVGLLFLASLSLVNAASFGSPAFQTRWERTDLPVQRGVAYHSWIWGPEPFTDLLSEAFVEGNGQRRSVQYFDKSRMEINDPNANPNTQWYVTNGLLVNELVQGSVQIGYNDSIPLQAANIPIAGDPDNAFPTYASLIRIYRTPAGRRVGQHVTSLFLREGAGELPAYAESPATEVVRVERDFGIPRAFWDFMNQAGTIYTNGRYRRVQPLFDWQYVIGYPTTEAFWTRVRVGGVERDVMFQAFERRLLTYTPANDPRFQVEMGNVGRHYYQWRYIEPFAGGQRAVITVPPARDPVAEVESPLMVRGFESGGAFEGVIAVRLKSRASGAVLASVNTSVIQADVGKPGPFMVTLSFPMPAERTMATIEVVTMSPRDGSEIFLTSRDVVIKANEPAKSLLDQVRRDLAVRLSMSTDAIELVRTEYVEWPDSALGCPAPDQVYMPVITPGYRIVLTARAQQYTYHTDLSSSFVLCQAGRPASR